MQLSKREIAETQVRKACLQCNEVSYTAILYLLVFTHCALLASVLVQIIDCFSIYCSRLYLCCCIHLSSLQIIVTTPEKWDVVTRKGGDGSLQVYI